MIKVPQSPVITSIKASLLDIIGEDCYKIIENYKESIERYEQNFNDIDECFKNKNNYQIYNMTINLEDLKDYCLNKKYDYNLEFVIRINGDESQLTYPLDVLKIKYLQDLDISTIKYTKKYQCNPWLEISLRDYKIEDMEEFLINYMKEESDIVLHME